MLNTWDIFTNCKNYPLGEIFHSDLELTMRETCNVCRVRTISMALKSITRAYEAK